MTGADGDGIPHRRVDLPGAVNNVATSPSSAQDAGTASPLLKIHVKSLEPSSMYTISVPVNASVVQLKECIRREADIDVQRQRLIFQGKMLKDDKILGECGLENEKTIHLVLRPLGTQANPTNDEPPRAHRPTVIPQPSQTSYLSLSSPRVSRNVMAGTIIIDVFPDRGGVTPQDIIHSLTNSIGGGANAFDDVRLYTAGAAAGIQAINSQTSQRNNQQALSDVNIRLIRATAQMNLIRMVLATPPTQEFQEPRVVIPTMEDRTSTLALGTTECERTARILGQFSNLAAETVAQFRQLSYDILNERIVTEDTQRRLLENRMHRSARVLHRLGQLSIQLEQIMKGARVAGTRPGDARIQSSTTQQRPLPPTGIGMFARNAQAPLFQNGTLNGAGADESTIQIPDMQFWPNERLMSSPLAMHTAQMQQNLQSSPPMRFTRSREASSLPLSSPSSSSTSSSSPAPASFLAGISSHEADSTFPVTPTPSRESPNGPGLSSQRPPEPVTHQQPQSPLAVFSNPVSLGGSNILPQNPALSPISQTLLTAPLSPAISLGTPPSSSENASGNLQHPLGSAGFMLMDVERNGISSVVGTPGGPPASWANLIARSRSPARPADVSSPSSTENKSSNDEAGSAQHSTKRRKLNPGSSHAHLQMCLEKALINSGVTDRTIIDRVLGTLVEENSGIADQFMEIVRGEESEGHPDGQMGQEDQRRDKGKGKANDS